MQLQTVFVSNFTSILFIENNVFLLLFSDVVSLE